MSNIASYRSAAQTLETQQFVSDNLIFKAIENVWSQPQTMLRIGLFACISFIAGVSIYDTYLVMYFRETILLDERNPICEALIRKDEAGLSWFVCGKVIGNLFVIGTLLLLYRFKYQYTLAVALAVASFQFTLLMFLWFSDHKTGFLHFDGLWSRDPFKYAQSLRSLVVHLLFIIVLFAVAAFVRIRCKVKQVPRLSNP
ncbi:MAG: hypothetical protein AB8B55_10160 [Mariniblastus sp.]